MKMEKLSAILRKNRNTRRGPCRNLKWVAVSLLLGAGVSPGMAAEPGPSRELTLNGRKLEVFQQESRPEWGYAKPQKDFFAVLSPEVPRRGAPLYVVLHSAGHDIFSCLRCTMRPGDHDIYHAPKDFYALYPDCRWNIGTDWWWGGLHLKDQSLMKRNAGPNPSAAEKRVIDTVKWAIARYGIDPDRVYLCGNSMGGSGALGIGMRNGDLFAAVKANVPAGIEHVSNRMYFPPAEVPAGVRLPDPPVVVDYSAQNDSWSVGHDRFVAAMRQRKYALLFFWGAFGHANNHYGIAQKNDLIHAFDWLNVRRCDAYPVFTNADSDDVIPWPNDLKNPGRGQINGFTRWRNVSDAAEKFVMELRVASAAELGTKQFKVPAAVKADVTLRRVRNFRIAPGDKIQWRFGAQSGVVTADSDGLATIPGVNISSRPATLVLTR